MSERPESEQLPEPSFADDLRFAAATWRRFPWLPVVSVGLFVASDGLLSSESALAAVGLVASLFYAGWIGTERICYLRASRGRGIERPELTRFTTAFILRFALLGLVLSLFLTPAFIVLFARRHPGDDPAVGTGFIIAVTILSIVGDVFLTFVTPALAFTTRRVRPALRLGVRMIKTEWPRSLPYVAIPPLVLVLGSRLITGRGEDQALVLIASGLSAIAGLWFKGAIAAFYLRRHWTGDDGAAFIDAPTTAPVVGETPARPDL